MALADEYKIVQDKIDKIGDYRFRVRGWSATVVSTLTVGTALLALPWGYFSAPAFVIALFALLDAQQWAYQQIWQGLANDLERQSRAAAAKDGTEPIALVGTIAKRARELRKRRRLLGNAVPLFYAGQLFLVIAVAAARAWIPVRPAPPPCNCHCNCVERVPNETKQNPIPAQKPLPSHR